MTRLSQGNFIANFLDIGNGFKVCLFKDRYDNKTTKSSNFPLIRIKIECNFL